MNIRLEADATDNDIELIEAIYKMDKYNITVCLNYAYNKTDELFPKVKKIGIPYYFAEAVSDWDILHQYINLGVSDIFVTGILGFELDKVKKVLSEKNIQIRCYANICQTLWSEGDTFKAFYIRPEDVDIYSEVIDVLEFYNAEDKQNVLYDVYFHSKKWTGDLREIIQGLKVRVNSYYLLGNEFALRRMKCGKKCLKGSNCHLCERVKELADTIENSDEYEVYERTMRNGSEGSNS